MILSSEPSFQGIIASTFDIFGFFSPFWVSTQVLPKSLLVPWYTVVAYPKFDVKTLPSVRLTLGITVNRILSLLDSQLSTHDLSRFAAKMDIFTVALH